MVLDFTPNSNN